MADDPTKTTGPCGTELVAYALGAEILRLRNVLRQIADRPMPYQHAAHLELQRLKQFAAEAVNGN